MDYYIKLSEMIQFKNGKPYWVKPIAHRVKVGDIAGTINNNGYRLFSSSIDFKVKRIYAHRLCWYMNYGELPTGNLVIDHIDRDRDNNSIDNLRVCTKGQNSRNRKGCGTSKYLGVHATGEKWIAQTMIDNKKYHLGTFSSEEKAHKAYQDFCNSKGVL